MMRWSTLEDKNMPGSFNHLSMSKKLIFCLDATRAAAVAA
jgi:hypothetical protein